MLGGPADRLGGVQRRSLAVQPEGPEGHHFDLSSPGDVLPVIDDRRDHARDTGPMVHAGRIVVHRVRVAVDEVVSVARAVGRIHPHVRLNVLVGPPHPRIDDGDDDGRRTERHVPCVGGTDLLHAPLIDVIGIVGSEFGMNRKARRDVRGADDGTDRPGDERGNHAENGQQCGHPSQ